MIPAMIARLNDRVPDLRGRVEGALALAALLEKDAAPAITPAAYVVPAGVTGGAETAFTGLYRQSIDRLATVVLCIHSRDRTGKRAMDEVEQLVEIIITSVAGWAPTNETGVFKLRQARLARFVAGFAVYEITFSLPDHLRITP